MASEPHCRCPTEQREGGLGRPAMRVSRCQTARKSTDSPGFGFFVGA